VGHHGPVVPNSYFVGGSNLNNLQNRIKNQIIIQNSKLENRKRIRSRKKIKEMLTRPEPIRPAQLANPPGACPGYRFGIRSTDGTHTVEEIIFFLSTCVRSTHHRRLHVDTVTVTSSQIFVGRHEIDLIPSAYWQSNR
jgi:hypothetical protein